MIEVIHFPNPICTVKFSSPVVQSATARGTRWNASPLPKRTAIIPNMVNCRFPLPLRIIYRFYCGRFCIKCFPCLCVPLSDIKAVQGDSGHAQVNMVTDAYSHIPDDDQRKNAELFKEAFYEKKNLNPERRGSFLSHVAQPAAFASLQYRQSLLFGCPCDTADGV